MVKKKMPKTSMSNVTSADTVSNENFLENVQDEDSDGPFLKKYPSDNRFQDFVQHFAIASQDKREACYSKTESQNIENSEKCMGCLVTFNKRMYSIACDCCFSWYCLNCSKKTKKEVTEMKKKKEGWICPQCNTESFKEINAPNQLEEENILLKQCIFEMGKKIDYLLEKLEKLEKNDTSQRLDRIENNINSLLIASKEKCVQNEEKKMYSDALRSLPSFPKLATKQNSPAIIIKPKTRQASKTTIEEARAKVNPSSVKASIKQVKELKNGALLLKVGSKDEAENLKKISQEKLGQSYIVYTSKLKIPQLVLIGLKEKYTEDELINELKQQNYLDVEDKIKLKYTRQAKHSKKYIMYIETIGRTFRKLVDQQIHLRWDTCEFKENFDLYICYKCCGYGHKSKECEKDDCCAYCSGNHNCWKCTESQFLCINCEKYNQRLNLHTDSRHKANSEDCPLHMKKIEEAKGKVDYSDFSSTSQ